MRNLLRKGVCVSLVDLVTVRRFNLYMDLLTLLGQTDPLMCPEPTTDIRGHLSEASGGRKDEIGHLGPAARRRSIATTFVHLADGNFVRVA